MRVLVHDFSGHPFQAQLSRTLARRGHHVCHAHCPSYQTGKGALDRQPDDPPTLAFAPVRMDEVFDRYHMARRMRLEVRYGRRFTRLAREFRPDVIVSSNDPLLAKACAGLWCRTSRTPYVFWLQDVYSVAMAKYAGARLGPLGTAAGAAFRAVERRLLLWAAAVVPITDDFTDQLRAWRVPEERCEVVENWAPLDELPPVTGRNRWAEENGLAGATVLLYAGTLGLKHDPAMLLELARRLETRSDACVVVVSEGAGASWLRERVAAESVDNLMVLPYQPYDRLPEMFATADVLVTLLSAEAGVYSVPSKVLSYLCAGRPVLAAMPTVNLAARVLERAGAGVVVATEDREGFLAAAEKLVSDPELRAVYGRRARAYAERAFDIEAIADRFEALLTRATSA